jgi:Acetoacetate decarboxylase (ADC)
MARTNRVRDAGPPAYVEYGARVTAPAPFRAQGGHLRGLVLEVDPDRIAALCRRVFGGDARGPGEHRDSLGHSEYRPLGRHVLLLVGHFERLSSLAHPFDQRGYVAETQASIWVPVAAGHRKSKTFVADRLCLVVPYMFVDNPTSLLGGREEFGYPKSLARFEPGDGRGARQVVETFGGDFDPDNRAGWVPVLELAERGALDGAQADVASIAERAWNGGGEIAQALRHPRQSLARKPSDAFIHDLVDDIVHARARQLFLKQVRAADDGTAACYKELIEAPVKVSNWSWRPSVREWEVTVHSPDSHPITADLGLRTQRTILTYELALDMTVEPGTVIRADA